MNEKDNIEYSILSCVFEEGAHCEIIKSEKPDFLLNFQGNLIGNVSVGVEITELYFDNTSARLKNKKGYVKDLIEKEKFAHKDDMKQLRIQHVRYYPQNSPEAPFNTKMVFLPNYSIDDYRASLLKAIKGKGRKFEKYNNAVNQTALVIYDQEQFLGRIYRQDFINNLFDSVVIKEIRESPFDEIYLITRFRDLPDDYFIQLKLYVLQNEIHILLDYINKNSLDIKLKMLNMSYRDCCAEVLIKKGYGNVKLSEKNDKPVLSCNRYSFYFCEEKRSMSLFDDFPKLLGIGENYKITDNINLFSEKSFNKFLKETKGRSISGNIGFKALKNRMK